MTAPRQHHSLRRLVQLAALSITAAALWQQLTRPPEQRTWEGRVVGVPYDFRPPTPARFRKRMWAPDNAHLVVPQVFGVGWTVNLGRLARELKRPGTSRSS
jgi:Family of unknown function (DUF5808)